MWSGYVYKIHCNIKNEDYYGSTEQDIEERMWHHKSHKETMSSQIIERGDWCYEIMEEVDYIIKVDLLIRERYYIENYPCINIIIPYRTKEEKRQYRRLHNRQYRIDNPDYLKRQRDIRNIKCECPCGGNYTNANRARHFKTDIHKRFIDDN
jgi:hypothetical protein